MTDPAQTNILRELFRDPQLYLIAIFVVMGSYLMKGEQVGATWFVGLGLVAFGVVACIVKLLQSMFDGAHKRHYTDVINAQQSAIKDMRRTIKDLSASSVQAHATMTQPTPIASGEYTRGTDLPTTTIGR